MVSTRFVGSSLRGAASLSRQSMVARTMATVNPRIGDRQVEMSNLEQGKFINYQRIEDNLQIVRSR